MYIRFKNAAPALAHACYTKQHATDYSPFYYTVPTHKVHIDETDDNFRIEVVAPGLEKEHFSINVSDELLTVGYKQSDEAADSKQKARTSSFERKFRLPKSVETEQISARYDKGILYVELPKKEEARPKPARRVEIA